MYVLGPKNLKVCVIPMPSFPADRVCHAKRIRHSSYSTYPREIDLIPNPFISQPVGSLDFPFPLGKALHGMEGLQRAGFPFLGTPESTDFTSLISHPAAIENIGIMRPFVRENRQCQRGCW